MKIAAIIMATMGLAGAARSAERIAVYIDSNNGPQEVIARAKEVSGRMFAAVGVAVDWRAVMPGGKQTISDSRAIVVEFEMNAAPGHHPAAMAYAKPYEGVHIVVLYDRILTRTRDNPLHRPMILAHVLTHEVTHVLQGIDRHSATGVMKARWDAGDYRDMTFSPLPFTPTDIDLIHIALRRRQTSHAATPVL
jgi:hypothetical protein